MNIYTIHKPHIVFPHKFVSFKRLSTQLDVRFDVYADDTDDSIGSMSYDSDDNERSEFSNDEEKYKEEQLRQYLDDLRQTIENIRSSNYEEKYKEELLRQYLDHVKKLNANLETSTTNQNGQQFETIPNNGVASEFDQTVSQSLLCGYMALAGGLYQMDNIDFSDIYKIIGLDEKKIVNYSSYISENSSSAVQKFQIYFGYELYEFSKSRTFYNFLLQQIQDFQFSDEEIERLLLENSNVDRQRLELLLSFILNGKVPLYINDEHSDVLVPHIRLINRDGKHWECVNFKHLT